MTSGRSATFEMTSDESRPPRAVDAGGVEALDSALDAALPGGLVTHAYDPRRVARFEDGGPPVWSVGVASHPSAVKQPLTHGLSRAVDPERPYGFELAIRVREPGDPTWAVLLLRGIARYHLTSGRDVRPGASALAPLGALVVVAFLGCGAPRSAVESPVAPASADAGVQTEARAEALQLPEAGDAGTDEGAVAAAPAAALEAGAPPTAPAECETIQDADEQCDCLLDLHGGCNPLDAGDLVPHGLEVWSAEAEGDARALLVEPSESGPRVLAVLGRYRQDGYTNGRVHVKRVAVRRAGPARVLWIETAISSVSNVPDCCDGSALGEVSYEELLTLCVPGPPMTCPVSLVPLRSNGATVGDGADERTLRRVVREAGRVATVRLMPDGSVVVEPAVPTRPGEAPPAWQGRFDLTP